jgi:hypothetical protein
MRPQNFSLPLYFALLSCAMPMTSTAAQDIQPKPRNIAYNAPGDKAVPASRYAAPQPAASGEAASAATAKRAIGTVTSSVEVHAVDLSDLNIAPTREAVRADIQSSAGTYGDFSRYLLMMPGVSGSANSDSMNDILVRGGHPSENLYVIDGFETPYINHFAVEGTTSGFTPMLNTSSIDKVSLQPGLYDSQYSSRLSSLIDIQTRHDEALETSEVSVGIAGLGGFWERHLGERGNLLLSADRSLMNLATSDLGLDGVPIFTNGMAHLEWSPDAADHLSFLNLSGADSIAIMPCAGDHLESLYIDTEYGGMRSTSGFTWLHTHDSTTVSKFTVGYASQGLEINQQDQLVNGVYQRASGAQNCQTPTAPVYAENTVDRMTTLAYNLRHDVHKWLLSAGSTSENVNLNYAVSQPVGTQSPFNPDPTWSDADSFQSSPLTTQTGSYAELAGPLGLRWTAAVGMRVETYGMIHASALEPHAGAGFRINDHQAIHAAWRRSAQLPAYIDLLSYSQNQLLKPVGVDQLSAGANVWSTGALTFSVEVYRKRYFNEPVSTQYPNLMLANMIYTPGEQFVWLPLASSGSGKSSGIEIMLRGHFASRLSALASFTYSRSKYAALDGVLRSGNYDIPLIGHALVNYRLPGEWNLSVRDSYTTGRPYTPYDIPLSAAQDRGIYDLSQVNALRGPAYNRVDIAFDHDFRIHRSMLNLYGGAQNILDRKNFLGYIWLDRCNQTPACLASLDGLPMLRVNQMPAFPVAGVRWQF